MSKGFNRSAPNFLPLKGGQLAKIEKYRPKTNEDCSTSENPPILNRISKNIYHQSKIDENVPLKNNHLKQKIYLKGALVNFINIYTTTTSLKGGWGIDM